MIYAHCLLGGLQYIKPVVGWTMLSRDEMRQVERSLASGEQDTRDEIGFLLLVLDRSSRIYATITFSDCAFQFRRFKDFSVPSTVTWVR